MSIFYTKNKDFLEIPHEILTARGRERSQEIFDKKIAPSVNFY